MNILGNIALVYIAVLLTIMSYWLWVGDDHE